VDKDVMLTPEGYEKLVEELEDLRTNQRLAVAERIREAREFGDISENSEYDDAKNEQAMLEAKIARLEERLPIARIVDAAGQVHGRSRVVVDADTERARRHVRHTLAHTAPHQEGTD